MTSIKDKLIIKLINHKIVSEGSRARKHLDDITRRPMQVQEEFLMKLLNDNKDTEYGRKYHFADIHSLDDFRRQLPLTIYDSYAEAIERMALKGEKNVLTAYDVEHYSKSSGTMGNPKLIPFSEKSSYVSNQYVKGCSYAVAGRHNMLGCTKGLNLVESRMETLPSGATAGSYTARLIKNYRKVFEFIQQPPIDVMMPQKPMNTRYLLSLYALKTPDLAYCICAFYSYFVEGLRFIERNWEQLCDDIELGRINPTVEMDEEVRQQLNSKMRKDPARAEKIRHIMQQHELGTLLVPLLWPKFRCIMGIGTAGFSTYTDMLRTYCGPDIHFLLQGVIASEGVFSTITDIDNPQSVLLPDSVFYEFKPEEQEDYDNLLTMDQLETGHNYELVITNLSGFYRYKMKDVVRVVGRYHETPTVEFMYRANQTVNLMGEKTTEIALREVAKETAKRCGFEMIDYCMYPNPEAVPVRYEFLIQPDGLPDDFDWQHARDVLDECLSEANPSMGDKLARGIVGKSKLFFLDEETDLLYRDMMALKGISTAQLKPVRVIDNVVRHNFFYALVDPRFDTPEEPIEFNPANIITG